MKGLERSYEVMKRIKRIHSAFQTVIQEELKETKLTAPQGMMVGIISKHGPQRITELSDKMGLSNSTVSAIVNRLERDGVVRRQKSPEDGRVVLVAIDETFKKNSKCIFEKIEMKWIERIKDSDPDDVEKVIEGLAILEAMLVGGEHDQTD